jgi:hypothetical protein
MVIKTRLTEKDFINVNFFFLFRKPILKIVFIIMVLNLILGLLSAVIPLTFLGEFTISRIVTPLVVLTFLPAVTYFTAKKNYASNQRLKELIEYKFEKDYLIIQGESFNSQLTWDKVYKVTETKKWILIWQSRQVANIIHKSDVWDGEMIELKTVLDEHHVKNNIS